MLDLRSFVALGLTCKSLWFTHLEFVAQFGIKTWRAYPKHTKLRSLTTTFFHDPTKDNLYIFHGAPLLARMWLDPTSWGYPILNTSIRTNTGRSVGGQYWNASPIQETLYVYFGQTLLEFKFNEPEPILTIVTHQSKPPGDRIYATSCNHQNNFLLFGGQGKTEPKWFNDVFLFDFLKKEWEEIQTTGQVPSGRGAPTACLYIDFPLNYVS